MARQRHKTTNRYSKGKNNSFNKKWQILYPLDDEAPSQNHQLILTICVLVIVSIVLIAVVIHDIKLRKKYPNFNHPDEQELDQDIQQFSYGTQFGDNHDFLKSISFLYANAFYFRTWNEEFSGSSRTTNFSKSTHIEVHWTGCWTFWQSVQRLIVFQLQFL